MPRFFVVCPLVLVGCSGMSLEARKENPGRSGSCEPVATVITAEETTPDGFTAASVIAGVGGPRATTLSYDASGAVTDLTIELVADGEIRWIEETWVPAADADTGEDASEPIPCDSYLEIDGTLRFDTADGAFAERVPIVLVGRDAGVGHLVQNVDHSALAGTYVPTELTPADWDEVWLEWTVNASAGSVAGEVALYATREGEDGWASDMARFPGP